MSPYHKPLGKSAQRIHTIEDDFGLTRLVGQTAPSGPTSAASQTPPGEPGLRDLRLRWR